MNEGWTRLSLLIAAGLLPLPLSAAPHPEASYYVDAYARHYQVPRELVNAIIQQESNWNDRAVSIKGACGTEFACCSACTATAGPWTT